MRFRVWDLGHFFAITQSAFKDDPEFELVNRHLLELFGHGDVAVGNRYDLVIDSLHLENAERIRAGERQEAKGDDRCDFGSDGYGTTFRYDGIHPRVGFIGDWCMLLLRCCRDSRNWFFHLRGPSLLSFSSARNPTEQAEWYFEVAPALDAEFRVDTILFG